PLHFDSYPWSHSLLMVAIAGAVAALLYRASGRPSRAAFFIALAAISHWGLDFVTHRPDMPLTPWMDTKLRLGLWNSVPATMAIEGAMFAGAAIFYARGRPVSKGFWGLVAFLLVVYVGNVFGPPPPSVSAIIGSMVLLVPLIWWWGNRVAVVDR